MTDDREVLDGRAVEDEGLDDWRLLFWALHARFETGDLAASVRLVAALGEAAVQAGRLPDVHLGAGWVDVRLTSRDVLGVTRSDVRLARAISALAAELGAVPRPDQTAVLELGLDTPDFAEVKPFWAALLGYEADADHDDELIDPDGILPTIWAQPTEPHETPRQRWHLDLRVPPETAEDRIRQALAAGGTLVSDQRAPAVWVLADAQGNRACVTTWLGREA